MLARSPDYQAPQTGSVADGMVQEMALISGQPTRDAAESGGALPLMSPLYNMREVCKQIVLLEDHLNQTEKRCPDCISKHFITIEALIEEGLALDKDGKYRDKLEGRAGRIRSLQSGWASGKDPAQIAQELRAIRKEWLPGCFDIQKVGGSILDESVVHSQARFPWPAALVLGLLAGLSLSARRP